MNITVSLGWHKTSEHGFACQRLSLRFVPPLPRQAARTPPPHTAPLKHCCRLLSQSMHKTGWLQAAFLCHCFQWPVWTACFNFISRSFHLLAFSFMPSSVPLESSPPGEERPQLHWSARAPRSNFTAAGCIAWTPWHNSHCFATALKLSEWSHQQHDYQFKRLQCSSSAVIQ